MKSTAEKLDIEDDEHVLDYLRGKPTEGCKQIGELLVGRDKKLKEDLAIAGNTNLYTTAVAAMVDQVLRPKLVAAGVIKVLDRKGMIGESGVKVPVNALPTAAAPTENTNIAYASNNYGGVTITKGWVAAAQKISQELLTASMVDILKDQLQLLGYAIAKKMDDDIVAAMQTASPTNDSNGNYIATGGASTRIDYVKFVDAVTKAKTNNADPDWCLLHPDDWGALMKDTVFKTALQFGTIPQSGSVLPQTQIAAGLKFLVSPVVPTGNTYFVDSTKIGYLAEWSPTITYDGRIPDQIAFEVIAAKAYGVGIVQPKSFIRVLMSI